MKQNKIKRGKKIQNPTVLILELRTPRMRAVGITVMLPEPYPIFSGFFFVSSVLQVNKLWTQD